MLREYPGTIGGSHRISNENAMGASVVLVDLSLTERSGSPVGFWDSPSPLTLPSGIRYSLPLQIII